MTTRIHVVNFGPDPVEVNQSPVTGGLNPTKLYPNQYADFWVYDNHDVLVKEVKEPKQGSAR